MISSLILKKAIKPHLEKIRMYDEVEIDNPNVFDLHKINYLDRINSIVKLVQKYYPNPQGIRIAEFGCAQGNISLKLAEKGYSVIALDQDSDFLEYSQLKHEKGDMRWVRANFSESGISIEPVDVAILGEIIEHCAYPEKIIENIASYVKPGGLCLITTPNGSRLKAQLPSFRQVLKTHSRESLEQRQFGPDGSDHLFLFTLPEALEILPTNSHVLESGYLGGSILINRISMPLLKVLLGRKIDSLIRLFSKIPFLNQRTFNNFYILMHPAKKNLCA